MNINKAFFLIFFIIVPPFLIIAEEAIVHFDENWAVNISGLFTIISFKEESGYYTSERPWALGIGVRYKNTNASFSLPLYYKSNEKLFDSFDIQAASYNEHIYYELFFKRYKGFTKGSAADESNNQNFDITIFSSGICAGWLLNGENHSLSAVYDLDRKQLISNGSLILGFGVNFLSIISDEEKIKRYNDRQSLIYFGPTIGYSYTFVFSNGLFLNANLIIGADAGINFAARNLHFIPLVTPKMSFGRHFNTWSFNITGSCIFTAVFWNTDAIDTLMPATIKLTFSKRF